MIRSILFTLLLFTSVLPIVGQSDSVVTAYLRDEYNVRFTEGNSVQILPTARDKFAALEKDLRNAQHSIHMDYFYMRDDSISNVIYSILREKASEGVEVRIILDHFGTNKGKRILTRRRFKELRKAGLNIRTFCPMRFPWLRQSLHRDHRKIVVIDGNVAYTGGINIADYYIKGNSKYGEWRDMHIRLTGPAVADMQKVFIDFWNHETKDVLLAGDYSVPSECYNLAAQERDSVTQRGIVGITNRIPSRVAPRHSRLHRVARDATRKAIDAAEHHIQIVNPYFAPSPMLRRAIKRALKRGVNTEIMISERSDINVTPMAVKYTAWRLAKNGAKVWIYQPGFHHSKVMTIDDRFSYVGSVNFDHRSMYSDYECNLLIADRNVTDSLQKIYQNDIQHSTMLNPKTWRKDRKLGFRIRCCLATILRPLL